MSTEGQLAELEKQHRDLDSAIAEESSLVSGDDVKIAKLKRRKLLLKDQIEQLKVVETVSGDTLH